jgi:lipocalin
LFVLFKKYAGDWYEIYRYEQSYSFGCQCVHVTYTLQKDGKVGVKNCCVRALPGAKDVSPFCMEAKAVVSYPDQQPLEGRLNVTFFGRKFNCLISW